VMAKGGTTMRVNPFVAAAVAALAAVAVGTAYAQEKKDAPPPMSAEDQADMQKWMAVATPGTPHKGLAALEGTWTAKVKSWMKPGAPPMESEGTAEQKMVLEGRFLEQRFSGNFMG